MRYVPRERIRLPNDWVNRAHLVEEEIGGLSGAERNRRINECSFIWHMLKAELMRCSHNKCWYCESIQDRSDNAVDHFRPKGKVAECADHEGYWWLAFSWTNYRFCCTYCNSHRKDQITGDGGKQDHFPLLDENRRARYPTDNLDREQPCLLDPTKTSDPGLLWFDEEGSAVPRYPQQEYKILYCRAFESIKFYHLNYYITKGKRETLYKDVERLVKEGDKYFNRFASGDSDIEYAFIQVLERLRTMLDEQSEFSAATRSFLLGLRSDSREWLDAFFAACLSG